VDDGIKQRLIGAVVLVALMIIFLPMFFGSGDMEPVDILIEIPEKPPVPEFNITQPVKPSDQRKAEVAEETPEQTLQELVDKEVDNKNLPVSWALQVASFKERSNAEKLRDKLRKSGYKAYIKYRLDVEPKMIRVLVGPVLERAEIDKIKGTITRHHKLEGVVVRYLP